VGVLRNLVPAFFAVVLLTLTGIPAARAAGPFGSIHVGGWSGGAFTDDTTGAFSHCGASSGYASGILLVVGQNAHGEWLLGFSSPAFHLDKGETIPIDVTFDGQTQARLFSVAISDKMVTSIMPPNVVKDFRKTTLMAAVARGATYQFNLTSTGPLLPVIASCVTKMKASGVSAAGDFTIAPPKPPVAAKPVVATTAAPPADAAAKSPKLSGQSGTGFVVSTNGHIVTNHHVINGCVGDIKGNLSGEAPLVLRVVSSDETNDLALLQASPATFKSIATIRDKAIRPGDTVVAIGYPFHGLLTSDFTVTTGIVSSLSGVLNDTRFLQISAAVQPGNSGGPLLDGKGQVVGIVAAKINALKFMKVTGEIPENINFAIKTGALRDFLDNSVVPYQTEEGKSDLSTADIARNARDYTLLISCMASVETARNSAETAKN
jgi:S1-C subfamily serine protease